MQRTIRQALLAASVGGMFALSACGGYSSTPGAGDYVTGNAADTSAAAPGAPAAAAPGADKAANAAPAAPVVPPAILYRKTIPKMGDVVTTPTGWVVYRFDKDSAKPSMASCNGTCAKIWPPVLTSGTPRIIGVDQSLVGKVKRADGRWQVTLKGWPLYEYWGDPAPGKWKGQGVGGSWWVIAGTGAKNLTCVPKGVPSAATSPAPGNPAAKTAAAAPAAPAAPADPAPAPTTSDGGYGTY